MGLKDLKKQREELDQKIRKLKGKTQGGRAKNFMKKKFTKKKIKKVGSRVKFSLDQAASNFWG